MDKELVFVIAAVLAGGIGVPLVNGIKAFCKNVLNKTLEGKAALWVSLIVTGLLTCVALALAGAFNPPYPQGWEGWTAFIGSMIGVAFAVATLIYKSVTQPVTE
jgi:hypothetical protein